MVGLESMSDRSHRRGPCWVPHCHCSLLLLVGCAQLLSSAVFGWHPARWIRLAKLRSWSSQFAAQWGHLHPHLVLNFQHTKGSVQWWSMIYVANWLRHLPALVGLSPVRPSYVAPAAWQPERPDSTTSLTAMVFMLFRFWFQAIICRNVGQLRS